MHSRVRRHLKLVAVVTAVMLALSGFSLARSGGGKGGGSRSGGSGGGGCGKDSSSSSSGYRYNGTSGGSSSSGSSGSSGSGSSRDREPDAEIVSCIAESGKTVVKLTSRGETDSYLVSVDFLDSAGDVVDTGLEYVRLKAGETKRVEVKPEEPALASRVRDCRLGDVY
ncbi:hypothetical protein GCM10010420_05640 [Streptomyces glaucosporus]|uniref:Secreted protein n=1 Tax=Streptomyces glaucosporus TaxID=284044 RepID=A0ABN3HR85_9ACTN